MSAGAATLMHHLKSSPPLEPLVSHVRRLEGSGIVVALGGSGLLAALSANCRQSARATELLNWLRQSETRHTLSLLIPGIESASPTSGSDSSAWQASTIATALAANANVSSELRLPRAEEYRSALADSLIAILSEDKPIADSLAKAAAAWQVITEARGRVLQRVDYEQSLGLTRD